ncbi:MAG TPA: PTS sugar transporter subunit IIB [Gemmatimonadales bacterium]|jgi:PTS system mannose-specific IIB component/fructoselysine and glucoselysine-specific PTS system IIB component|nr:PTS sugar transporter subunit IIB [Gemmatimonadales bacterium]
MSIVLCRIDDRLIHGQVVVGWGRALGIDLIVLVDDQVAGSSWEQELYRMAVTPEIDVRFVTVTQASTEMAGWQSNGKRGLLLTGDLETMAALHAASPEIVHRINLGGIHHRAGRRERLPFVYLTDQELRKLQELETDGAVITAQDLPTTPPVPLRSLG